ncbi:AraC family transcriptional regulator [Clostridium oryzae]|uniref:HTH-type transcriptional regulator YesS n=1 Tax=Clostridium oryzae TaxID=1450648 RepID=A0A1V4IDZ2_9CLOT|nr:helix-turn-helix domain-containing protein [Clostridium oryzae]OPJ58173.1 HTH-type transcriptional regulator YesS [Clostridium oryzae]
MIREKELLALMKHQEEIIRSRANTNIRQMLEEEFVVSNIFSRYLDYIEKCKIKDKTIDLIEMMNKTEAPIKKTVDFDISKQDFTCPMYLHRHTYIELDYVYKGSCNYYINNENRIICLKEKQMCIVNQNIIHGIETFSEDDIIIKCMIPFQYIEMDPTNEIGQDITIKKFLMQALNENLTKASYLVFNIIDAESMLEIMYHLFFEFSSQRMGWKQSVRNYLSLLFLHLMRIPKEDICIAKEIEEENLSITKILNYIQKNYQYITLKDIANDLHFNENYLSRMIKEKTQHNFRDLVCQTRLKEAEKLLLNTKLSVAQIAVKVGYHKPNFFYKLFKEHYGATPTEFRMTGTLKQNDK